MNAPIGQKNRPYQGRITVKNGEASSNILTGTPVCLSFSLTDDGVNVVLPSTGGAAKATPFAVGIAVVQPTDQFSNPYAVPGQYFDVICTGLCSFTRLSRGTKAASTAAWPSFAAIALGDILNVDTVANALVVSAAGAASAVPPGWVFAGVVGATDTTGQVLASTTTAASSAYTATNAGALAASATAYTLAVKSFLRVI